MLPIEKYNNIVKMKWSACHERGTKNKSESLTGFQPMISQTPGRGSTHVIYELFFTVLLFVLYLIEGSFTEYAGHCWAALNHILRYNFVAFFGRASYSLASYLPYLVKKK